MAFFSTLGVGGVLWMHNPHRSFWLEARDGKDGKRRQPGSGSPNEYHFLHRNVFFWDESQSLGTRHSLPGTLFCLVPFQIGVPFQIK